MQGNDLQNVQFTIKSSGATAGSVERGEVSQFYSRHFDSSSAGAGANIIISSNQRQITPLRYKTASGSVEARVESRSPISTNVPDQINLRVSQVQPVRHSYAYLGHSASQGLTRKEIDGQAKNLREQFHRRISTSRHVEDLTNIRQMIGQMKEEQRGFLESELKVALMDIKNNLFEQQFGFERHIVGMMNKLTVDLKASREAEINLEIRGFLDLELQKFQKTVATDISGLQQWVNSLHSGVESFKKTQEENNLYLKSELKLLKDDLFKLRNDELKSISLRFSDINALVLNRPVSNNSEEINKIQQSLNANKTTMAKLQDMIESLHRQVITKSDKESTDNTLLAIRNETENLRVKLQLSLDKHLQFGDEYRNSLGLVQRDLNAQFQSLQKQYNTDLLVIQGQIQGFSDVLSQKFEILNSNLKEHDLKIASALSIPRQVDHSSQISQLQNYFEAKIAGVKDDVLKICNASLAKLDIEIRKSINEASHSHVSIQDKLSIFFTDKINAQLKDIHSLINAQDSENKRVNLEFKSKLGALNGIQQQVSSLEIELKRKISDHILALVRGEIDQTKGLYLEIDALKRTKVDTDKKLLTASQEVETLKQLVFQLEPFKQDIVAKVNSQASYYQKDIQAVIDGQRILGDEISAQLKAQIASLRVQLEKQIGDISGGWSISLEGKLSGLLKRNGELELIIEGFNRQIRDLSLSVESVRKDILVSIDLGSVNKKYSDLSLLISELKDSQARLSLSFNDQLQALSLRHEKELVALRDATARLSADLQLELKSQIQASITTIKFPDFDGMLSLALSKSSSGYEGKFSRLEANIESLHGQLLGALSRESQAREELRKALSMRIDQVETHVEDLEGLPEELNSIRASLNGLSVDIKTFSSNNARELALYMDLLKKLEAKFLQDFAGLDILIQGIKKDYSSLHGLIINVDFKSSLEAFKAEISGIISQSSSRLDQYYHLVQGIQMEIGDINGRISAFVHLEGLVGKLGESYKHDIAELTAQFNLLSQSFKGLNLDAVIGLHIKGLDEKLLGKYNALVDRVNALQIGLSELSTSIKVSLQGFSVKGDFDGLIARLNLIQNENADLRAQLKAEVNGLRLALSENKVQINYGVFDAQFAEIQQFINRELGGLREQVNISLNESKRALFVINDDSRFAGLIADIQKLNGAFATIQGRIGELDNRFDVKIKLENEKKLNKAPKVNQEEVFSGLISSRLISISSDIDRKIASAFDALKIKVSSDRADIEEALISLRDQVRTLSSREYTIDLSQVRAAYKVELEGLAKLINELSLKVQSQQSRSDEFYLSVKDLGSRISQFDSRILVLSQRNEEHLTEELVKRATGDLVVSIGRLEGEMNRKISQIRQLIDETRELRAKQDDKLNLIFTSQGSYEERLKALDREFRINFQGVNDLVGKLEGKLSAELSAKISGIRVNVDVSQIQQLEGQLVDVRQRLAAFELQDKRIVDALNDFKAQQASYNASESVRINKLTDELIRQIQDQNAKIMRIRLFIRISAKLAQNLAQVRNQQGVQLKTINSLSSKVNDQDLKLNSINNIGQFEALIAARFGGFEQKLMSIVGQLEVRIGRETHNKAYETQIGMINQEIENLREIIESHSHANVESHLYNIAQELGRLRSDMELVETESKNRDIELSLRCEQNDEALRIFCQNIIDDMEYFESKLVTALQRDTLAIISQEELEPLKARITKLETTSLSPSRHINLILEDGESKGSPSTATRLWHLEHQRLLDDMRRRRLFYLRKTPMDQRIEEIMKANDCSQTEAFKIYQEELEKGGRSSITTHQQTLSVSPHRRRRGDFSEDYGRPSLFQSLYHNVGERSQSPQTNNNIGRISTVHVEKSAAQLNESKSASDIGRKTTVIVSNSAQGPFEPNFTQSKIKTTQNVVRQSYGKDDANFDVNDFDERDDRRFLEERFSGISPNKHPNDDAFNPRVTVTSQVIKKEGGEVNFGGNDHITNAFLKSVKGDEVKGTFFYANSNV